ncbi:hypothetical protein MLD52_03745 [Puniceicoccaceae bacterium K14]|nr:hypothetical protein [Puniceicoccaceae bacterium K14]
MPIDELVAINSLLIKRESELSRLSQIERSVSEILGQRYPFEAPKEPLPSTQKRKATKAKKRPKAKKTPKIRRLKQGEIAYRVTTLEHGEPKEQDLIDVSSLQALLENPLPHCRIQTIHTISEDLTPIDRLLDQ